MIKNQFCDSLGENASKFWVDISDQILIFGTHHGIFVGWFLLQIKI